MRKALRTAIRKKVVRCRQLGLSSGPMSSLHRLRCSECRSAANADAALQQAIGAWQASVQAEHLPDCIVLPAGRTEMWRASREQASDPMVLLAADGQWWHVTARRAWSIARRSAQVTAVLCVFLACFVRWQDRTPSWSPATRQVEPAAGFTLYCEAARAVPASADLCAAFAALARNYRFDQVQANSLAPQAEIASPPPGGTTVAESLFQQERRVLGENRRSLALLRRGFRYAYEEPSIRTAAESHDYYSGYVRLAWLLALEADYHFRTGHPGSGLSSALDAIRLGITCQAGAPTIGRIAGLACEQIGRAILWAHLTELSASEAARAARVIEDLESSRQDIAVAYRISGDTASALFLARSANALWRFRVLDSERHTPTAPERALGFLLTLPHSRHSVLATIQRVTDESVRFAALPYPKPLRTESRAGMFDALAISSTWWPEARGVQLRHDVARADTALLETALALRAYRIQRGGPSKSLADLVQAGYLRRVPTDPFGSTDGRSSRAFLRYTPWADGPVVYSVGPDGLDDGGVPIVNAEQFGEYAVHAGARGDIVGGINITLSDR